MHVLVGELVGVCVVSVRRAGEERLTRLNGIQNRGCRDAVLVEFSHATSINWSVECLQSPLTIELSLPAHGQCCRFQLFLFFFIAAWRAESLRGGVQG